MSRIVLPCLGGLALLARKAGMGRFLSLTRDLADAILVRMSRPPLTANLDGLQLYGFFRHRSFLAGVSKGNYEPFTRDLFEKALSPKMVVIDGGAHIGLYSILASRGNAKGGRIFAFEPDLYSFRALQFNLIKNKCFNVIPVDKAISNSGGTRWLYRSAGTIASSLFPREGCGTRDLQRVDCTTLDQELRELGAIESILIKLDIEGAEPLALQQVKHVVQKVPSVVVIAELNPSALHAGGFSPKDLIRQLGELNLEVYYIGELERRLVPILDDHCDKKGNLYCTKKAE